MDHIREALIKARASLERPAFREHRETPTPLHRETPSAWKINRPAPAPPATPSWTPRRVTLSAAHLERQRIVSFAMSDPSHLAFNLLRTRTRKALQDHGWKTVGVTSPTAGCGKTMVAINLAFSLARAPDCRTVLMDFDFRKPAVAHTLGMGAIGSLDRYLEGKIPAQECFVQVSDKLFVGANSRSIKHSSEIIQSTRVTDLISAVQSSLLPDVIIFDLPPMGAGDDALAFLARVDAALLVTASGTTTAAEVEECERQISEMNKLLGIVLNKSEARSKDYYY